MAASDVLYANNITLSLAAPLGSGDASMVVSSSTGVPAITPPAFFYATVEDYTTGAIEIVKVTARSGTTWTITRAQDSTLAQAFDPATSIVQLRPISQHLRDLWTAIGALGAPGDTVPTYLEDGNAPASIGAEGEIMVVRTGALVFEAPAAPGDSVPAYFEDGNAPASIGDDFDGLMVLDGALLFSPLIYDLFLGFGGTYEASEELVRHTFVRGASFPANLTGSKGTCRVGPTSTSVTLSLKKNGVEFGTVVFAAAATTCTFTSVSGATFVEGDYLTLVAPAGLNASFVDVGITLKGVRGPDSGGAP